MEDVERIRATIDEHGRCINQYGDQIAGLTLVIVGDSNKHVRGLLERTEALENLAQELASWKRDINTSMRVGIMYLRILAITLGVIGLAAWRDGILTIISIFGG